MILRVSGSLLALLSLFPLSLHAQSQASDASLSGFVLTKDGSRLAGARVKARNLSTGLEREQTTTDSGAYTLTLLPPGLYRVSAELAGFNAVTRESITLRAGQAATIDFDLPVGDVATIVNVTEAIPVVETGKTVQSNTYDERAARAIPVAGRSLLDFFVLQPGVNAPPLSTGGSGTGTPSTVYGGTGFRQMNVDGVSNNIQGGARNLVISQEAIAEFQTVTNFSAEFGRVAGGLQNAFTRSGTNEWHGSGFFFHRRRELAATPKLLAPGAPKPDFFRSNYGGTGGGPLRRNKAFLFTSYERWEQDLPVVSTFGGANQVDIARQLGIPSENIGAFITTFRAHTLTTKADWELHPKHRLSSRFNYYFDRESPLQGGLQTREVSTRFDEDPFSVTSQLVSSISPTLVNEFRFHFARRPIENGVLFPERPQINISGIGSFNGNSSGVFSSREMGYQFINNLTWIRGRHTLKFGADLLPVRFRERTRNVNGTFQFDNLPQYLNTINGVLNPATGRPFTYSRFTQSVGQEFFDPQVVNQGYFIQDDVRLTSRLKLNLGLRYELFLRPAGNLNPAFASTGVIPQDYNNIAPRLGLAWDVTGNGRTVIR
ncbi:MAG: TonB-dependent receptor, partial [Bryobacteraceae bacterium]|nr:TonB-dependent receptor [Bryobacteraceae bacterium]